MDNRAPILTGETIIARAEAIGVKLPDLATDAGYAPSTLYRWKSGGEPNSRTLRAVQTVLIAKERALLSRLIDLHPDMAERKAA